MNIFDSDFATNKGSFAAQLAQLQAELAQPNTADARRGKGGPLIIRRKAQHANNPFSPPNGLSPRPHPETADTEHPKYKWNR